MSNVENDAPHAESGRPDESPLLFRGGLNCAQALLVAYGGRFGLDREEAIKIGAAFGAGMGLGETCGAVTGALMVIGLKHTQVKGGRLLSKELTEIVAQQFMTRFRELHGSVICRELLGCDINKDELDAAARENLKGRCSCLVRDAAMLIEELTEAAR